jgi:hypothetical protein
MAHLTSCWQSRWQLLALRAEEEASTIKRFASWAQK